MPALPRLHHRSRSGADTTGKPATRHDHGNPGWLLRPDAGGALGLASVGNTSRSHQVDCAAGGFNPGGRVGASR